MPPAIVRPLNYRHAFHAGNFADVVKHAALVALLEAFKGKPKPFCYFDSHAGRGLYDLGDAAALKTGEAVNGIARVLAADGLPEPLAAYAAVVRATRAESGAGAYPGSPEIAAQRLRPGDSAILCELQPDEAAALRARYGRRGFHVHARDGYEALAALLPPAEKRGVVLIDPPFEAQAAEFRLIQAALDKALARWPTGCYAVWYPIKLGRDIEPFHRWLRGKATARGVVAELLIHPDNTALRLNGCGLAILNAPWHFDATLHTMLTALVPLLAPDGGSQRVITFGADA